MSDAGISREKALELLTANLTTPNLIKHCLATEVIMRHLAPRFDADPEAWGITGLLHDIDLDLVKDDLSQHGHKGAQMAADAGLAPQYVEAISRHMYPAEEGKRETTLDFALSAAETITGLIVATALVYPDKKIASVKPKSVKKRIKEPRFAAGANREHIRECEKIGIELPEFVDIALSAMKTIGPDLGL